MKERQRWRTEEDGLLRAYVKQYGPREWHLVSQRMNTPLNRDAKSCLERWKNYLKPGIKKGSLSEEEQLLVIRLQAKHGNKWKKIAAEVPGRTAKRLGKWWEVFKEKQQREQKENTKIVDPIEDSKYDQILENFAEKLVKDRPPQVYMGTSSVGFLHPDQPAPSPPTLLPAWLSNTSTPSNARPPSPSVTLSLSPSTAPLPTSVSWLHPERGQDNTPLTFGNMPSHVVPQREHMLVSELLECCRGLEEGHNAWAAHKKEAAWRLKRVELQLESEKMCRQKEKMEEIEAKVKALREEEKVTLDRIEAEYKEQLAGLRRNAEAKEQKLAENWAAKHLHLAKFIEQMGGHQPRLSEPNGR